MSDNYPIEEQQGLSKEQLANMKPVEQKYDYKWNESTIVTERHDTPLPASEKEIKKQNGVPDQKEHLRNLLKECFIEYDKDRANMDSKDSFGTDKCIRNFADRISDALVKVMLCQKVNIKTKIVTSDATVGSIVTTDGLFTFTGAGTGKGEGIAKPTDVIIE